MRRIALSFCVLIGLVALTCAWGPSGQRLFGEHCRTVMPAGDGLPGITSETQLEAHWRFSKNPSGQGLDATGHGYNVTNWGTHAQPTFSADGAYFSGGASMRETTKTCRQNLNDGGAIIVKCKTTGYVGYPVMVRWECAARPGDCAHIAWAGYGTYNPFFSRGYVSYDFVWNYVDERQFLTNQWHYVGVEWGGGVASTYGSLNGGAVVRGNTGSFVQNFNTASSNMVPYFGLNGSTEENPFTGYIAACRIYTGQVSVATIISNMIARGD
jgi:hypothetical protein